MSSKDDIYQVKLSRQARKDLKKIPKYLVIKLAGWVDAVEHQGLSEIRKIPGYHDEALRGTRVGQRSIRLNNAYRAIYVIIKNKINFVEVMEVNKHGY